MGNAQVAAILGSQAMIVTGGGSAADRRVRSQPLMFDQEGCRVIGMVASKFLPGKTTISSPCSLSG